MQLFNRWLPLLFQAFNFDKKQHTDYHIESRKGIQKHDGSSSSSVFKHSGCRCIDIDHDFLTTQVFLYHKSKYMHYLSNNWLLCVAVLHQTMSLIRL